MLEFVASAEVHADCRSVQLVQQAQFESERVSSRSDPRVQLKVLRSECRVLKEALKEQFRNVVRAGLRSSRVECWERL